MLIVSHAEIKCAMSLFDFFYACSILDQGSAVSCDLSYHLLVLCFKMKHFKTQTTVNKRSAS